MAEKEWVERKALVEEIREAQRRLESCDDIKWERNKPYFKGLASYEQMKWERDVAMQQLNELCGAILRGDGRKT